MIAVHKLVELLKDTGPLSKDEITDKLGYTPESTDVLLTRNQAFIGKQNGKYVYVNPLKAVLDVMKDKYEKIQSEAVMTLETLPITIDLEIEPLNKHQILALLFEVAKNEILFRLLTDNQRERLITIFMEWFNNNEKNNNSNRHCGHSIDAGGNRRD